jgi:hypothetical protein
MPIAKQIAPHKQRERAQQRQRRIIAVVVVAALVGVAGALALQHMAGRGSAPAQATVVTSAAPSPRPSPSPTVSTDTLGIPVPRPPIVKDYIAFGAKRRAEMATYARLHYGSSSIVLHPKLIVLHYTATSTYESAHATFAADVPNMGVLPGTVAHFIIDKDGIIYQQLPLDLMGRHVVGLNYCAIGVENVQEARATDAEAVAQILARPAQRRALIALVRWLMYRYHIPLKDVIGHGMANASPYFKDLLGWTNDHTDWQRPEVMRLRVLLKATS